MHRTALTLAIVLLAVPFDAAAVQVTTHSTHLRAPNVKTIPDGPMGDAIRYGNKVFTQTQTYAAAYVGNGLNCTSCHLDAGKKGYTATVVGLWGVFTEYRLRWG